MLARTERASRAAEQAAGARGRRSGFLRAIFVPEDETCLLVFEAASVESVRRCAHLAGLPVEHIVEAIVVDPEIADVG